MTVINYVENGESGNETVLNRPLREALTALGLNPDDVTSPWTTEEMTDRKLSGIRNYLLSHRHDHLYSQLGHTHDTRYYTEAEVDALIAGVSGGSLPLGSFMNIKRNFSWLARDQGGTVQTFGSVWTAFGTVSTSAVLDTNAFTRIQKLRYAGTTAAGQLVGPRGNETVFVTRDGFKFRSIFGMETNINDSRAFFGLTTTTVPLNADSTTHLECLGMGWDQADLNSGNWWFFHNDGAGAATRIDTGIARGTNQLFRLEMDSTDGTSVTVRVVNVLTGAQVFSTTINTNLPPVSSIMRFNMTLRNEVTAGGTAPVAVIVNLYCEYGPYFA